MSWIQFKKYLLTSIGGCKCISSIIHICIHEKDAPKLLKTMQWLTTCIKDTRYTYTPISTYSSFSSLL